MNSLVAFEDPIFKKTLKKALKIVIDTMFRSENDEEYREILNSRFSDVIDRANGLMTTAICAKDTEDEDFPYYYAVVDAKSFGKYLIPTYKSVPDPVQPDPVQPDPVQTDPVQTDSALPA